MAKIGIIPGQDFDINKQEPKIAKAIENAPKLGLQKIMAHKDKAGNVENGWIVTTKTGKYGANYLQKAFIAAVGLGANLPQDAIYPMTNVDIDGQQLNGDNDYVIHFDKGKTPPVKGFWSLTMYSDELFFTENKLNRFSLSRRNDLKYNDDGSLDLYIQNASPGKEDESNWLPAPEGDFVLMFRFFWPEEAIIKGSWKPPVVEIDE